jgi:hypothetical protein
VRTSTQYPNSTDINSFCSDSNCSRQSGNRLRSIYSPQRPRFRTKRAHLQHAIVIIPVPNSFACVAHSPYNKKSQTSHMRCYRSVQVMGTRASPKQWSHSRFLEASILTNKRTHRFVRRSFNLNRKRTSSSLDTPVR